MRGVADHAEPDAGGVANEDIPAVYPLELTIRCDVRLAVVVGEKPLPRTEVVKKLWAYIKKHNLQDPKNRRNIRADAVLTKVFGGKEVVSMFEMTKLVNKQLAKSA